MILWIQLIFCSGISSLSTAAQTLLQENVSLSMHLFSADQRQAIIELADAKLVTTRPLMLDDVLSSYTIPAILELCTAAKPEKATRRIPVIKFFEENYPDNNISRDEPE